MNTPAAARPAAPPREPPAWHALLAWVLSLLLVAALMPWRDADWALFAHLPRLGQPSLDDPRLWLVDLPHSEDEAEFRPRLAALLRHLASHPAGPPKAVVLDIHIQAKPVALDTLVQALGALRQAAPGQSPRCLVFGAVDLRVPGQARRLDPGYLARHAREVYVGQLDGFGHTLLGRRGRTAAYSPYLELPGGELRAALPVVVAEHAAIAGLQPGSLAPMQLLDTGDAQAVRARTLRFDGQALRPPEGVAMPATLADKILLVGSLGADLADPGGRPGPELLAWALNAQLRNARNPGVTALLASPWLLLLLVLACAALSALAVGLAARRWAGLRGGRCAATPLAGLAAGLVLLLAASALALLAGHSLAQWTLPLASTLLASVAAWWQVRRLRAYADKEKAALAPAATDLFISYSHHAPDAVAWLQRHVVDVLADLRRPDGQPLAIFVDRDGIRQGDAWPNRLTEAINQSRVFVAVYTADYFDEERSICLAEMAQANAQRVRLAGRGLKFILPVLRDAPRRVPDAYSDIQYLDAAAPGFAQALRDAVQRELRLRRALELQAPAAG